MQTGDIMERDRDRYMAMEIAPMVPAELHGTRQLCEAFAQMVGTTIVSIGTPYSDEIEGGGLIIDYTRPCDPTVHRIVFAFNELGMWVEWDSRA